MSCFVVHKFCWEQGYSITEALVVVSIQDVAGNYINWMEMVYRTTCENYLISLLFGSCEFCNIVQALKGFSLPY